MASRINAHKNRRQAAHSAFGDASDAIALAQGNHGLHLKSAKISAGRRRTCRQITGSIQTVSLALLILETTYLLGQRQRSVLKSTKNYTIAI
jgi:hypothetical protein